MSAEAVPTGAWSLAGRTESPLVRRTPSPGDSPAFYDLMLLVARSSETAVFLK